MKNKEFKELVHPIAFQLTLDTDAYLFVHFSSQEDKFEAIHNNMDGLDAMIVIKNLVKHFNIDPLLLTTVYDTNQ
jgi:hypothetical protein